LWVGRSRANKQYFIFGLKANVTAGNCIYSYKCSPLLLNIPSSFLQKPAYVAEFQVFYRSVLMCSVSKPDIDLLKMS